MGTDSILRPALHPGARDPLTQHTEALGRLMAAPPFGCRTRPVAGRVRGATGPEAPPLSGRGRWVGCLCGAAVFGVDALGFFELVFEDDDAAGSLDGGPWPTSSFVAKAQPSERSASTSTVVSGATSEKPHTPLLCPDVCGDRHATRGGTRRSGHRPNSRPVRDSTFRMGELAPTFSARERPRRRPSSRTPAGCWQPWGGRRMMGLRPPEMRLLGSGIRRRCDERGLTPRSGRRSRWSTSPFQGLRVRIRPRWPCAARTSSPRLSIQFSGSHAACRRNSTGCPFPNP